MQSKYNYKVNIKSYIVFLFFNKYISNVYQIYKSLPGILPINTKQEKY